MWPQPEPGHLETTWLVRIVLRLIRMRKIMTIVVVIIKLMKMRMTVKDLT